MIKLSHYSVRAIVAAMALLLVLGVTARSGAAATDGLDFELSYLYRSVFPADSGVKPITQGAILYSGDSYQVVFSPATTAYVFVMQVDESGEVFVLFPPSAASNPVSAGQQVTLPAPGKADILDDTLGTERFFFLAARQPGSLAERLWRRAARGDLRGDELLEALGQDRIHATRGLVRALPGATLPIRVPSASGEQTLRVPAQRIDDLCSGCVNILEFEHR